jgi:hypothetical protein
VQTVQQASNAEATAAGFSIISCDPLYRFTATEIRDRIADTTEVILDQTRRNQHEFVWTSIRSIEELRELRVSSMERFLDDFETGQQQGRYLDAELPNLPFADGAFGLALCSHFLFLYSEQLTEDFHVAAIREMSRVASEVRVFPLLALGAKRSRHVDPVCERLRQDGYFVAIEQVPYEFQRGGNQMIRVRFRQE